MFSDSPDHTGNVPSVPGLPSPVSPPVSPVSVPGLRPSVPGLRPVSESHTRRNPALAELRPRTRPNRAQHARRTHIRIRRGSRTCGIRTVRWGRPAQRRSHRPILDRWWRRRRRPKIRSSVQPDHLHVHPKPDKSQQSRRHNRQHHVAALRTSKSTVLRRRRRHFYRKRQ